MIVVQASDPRIRRAVLRSARLEEDVVADAGLAVEAIERGFPRLVVRDGAHRWPPLPEGVRLVELTEPLMRRWEDERSAAELPPTRAEQLAEKVAVLVQGTVSDPSWVDVALSELAHASGRRLPGPLRAFGRRVLEFPSHYTTLRPLSKACATTPGALKARFRRRDLSTPSTCLRWFRLMAVARLLSDREVTVAEAAARLGFTSDGNLCRTMWNVLEMTPTEARSVRGWNRILVSFAWLHLTPPRLEAWSTLDDLFVRRTA